MGMIIKLFKIYISKNQRFTLAIDYLLDQILVKGTDQIIIKKLSIAHATSFVTSLSIHLGHS